MSKLSFKSTILLQTLFTTALLTSCAVAHAAPQNGWWLSLGGGIMAATTPTAQDINWIAQSTPITYAPQTAGTGATVLLGYGYQYALESTLFPAIRLGAQYQYLAPITIKGGSTGSIIADYDYQDKVSSNVLWLDSQFDIVTLGKFTPYIEVGVGAALNNFNGYSETYAADEVHPPVGGNAMNFANKSSVQVATKAGVGINYNITVKQGKTLAIGAFYNYVNLGNANSGAAPLSGSPTLIQNLQGNVFGLSVRYSL